MKENKITHIGWNFFGKCAFFIDMDETSMNETLVFEEDNLFFTIHRRDNMEWFTMFDGECINTIIDESHPKFAYYVEVMNVERFL